MPKLRGQASPLSSAPAPGGMLTSSQQELCGAAEHGVEARHGHGVHRGAGATGTGYYYEPFTRSTDEPQGVV